MDYIIDLLPIFIPAVVIAAIIYAGVFFALKKRREKPKIGIMFAEYVLVGWVLMFIYVTQLNNSFGGGGFFSYNIVPFRMFYVAYHYGSTNTTLIWQYLLNVLMVVPLGVLLPIVSPKKFRKWYTVTGAAFAASLATEFVQLFTGRGTDIDDLTANTIGGLCGYALFLLVYSIIRIVSGHKGEGGLKNIVAAVLIFAVVAVPYAVVPVFDSMSKYGFVQYDHPRPDDFSLQTEISDEETVLPVYQYQETESLDSLKKRLLKLTGFEGEFKQDENGDWVLQNQQYSIIIFSYGCWSVSYFPLPIMEDPLEYAFDAEGDFSSSEQNVPDEEPPDEETLEASAWEALERFGFSKDDVAVSKDMTDFFNDGHGYLQFEPVNHDEKKAMAGSISVEIDHDGKLISIDNYLVSGMLVEKTECISQREALGISKDVGGDEWGGTCTVKSVHLGYTLIEDTGYLVPCWIFEGEVYDNTGKAYEWEPFISAVK